MVLKESESFSHADESKMPALILLLRNTDGLLFAAPGSSILALRCIGTAGDTAAEGNVSYKKTVSWEKSSPTTLQFSILDLHIALNRHIGSLDSFFGILIDNLFGDIKFV